MKSQEGIKMFFLILLLLLIISIAVIKQRKKVQAKQIYWEHINAIEAQQKQRILHRALETQRALENKKLSDSKI